MISLLLGLCSWDLWPWEVMSLFLTPGENQLRGVVVLPASGGGLGKLLTRHGCFWIFLSVTIWGHFGESLIAVEELKLCLPAMWRTGRLSWKVQGHPDPSSVSGCPKSVHPHGQWVCDCPDPALKESRVLGQSWRGRWHKHNTSWDAFWDSLGNMLLHFGPKPWRAVKIWLRTPALAAKCVDLTQLCYVQLSPTSLLHHPIRQLSLTGWDLRPGPWILPVPGSRGRE